MGCGVPREDPEVVVNLAGVTVIAEMAGALVKE